MPTPTNGQKETTLEIDGAIVIKSPNRKRTISWRWLDGRLVLRVPVRYTRKEISAAIQLAHEKAKTVRRSPRAEDQALRHEAEDLNKLYFDGKLKITAIGYAEMATRRGSCSTDVATIRISTRLATVPVWVRRAVIHHELCHLVEPNHGPAFKDLEARYPLRGPATDYLRLLEIGPDDGTRLHLTDEDRLALADILRKDGTAPHLLGKLEGHGGTQPPLL